MGAEDLEIGRETMTSPHPRLHSEVSGRCCRSRSGVSDTFILPVAPFVNDPLYPTLADSFFTPKTASPRRRGMNTIRVAVR